MKNLGNIIVYTVIAILALVGLFIAATILFMLITLCMSIWLDCFHGDCIPFHPG